MKGVNQPDDGPVRTNQDGLAVPGELQPRPVALLLLVQLERHERSLVEGPQIVQLDALRVDPGREDEPLRIVRRNGTPVQVHHPLTIGRPQIPQPQRFVQRSRQKSILHRRNVQRNDLLRVARKVPQIFVVVQTQVPDRVVDLRRTVDGRIVGVCKVDQIHPVLLRVDRPDLGALLAIVQHDLVVLAATYQHLPVGREVDRVDLVRVFPEHFGHFEAANDRVDQLHLDYGRQLGGRGWTRGSTRLETEKDSARR